MSERNNGNNVNLIVEITHLEEFESKKVKSVLICKRCESPEEIVVSIVRIPALATTLTLCGPCMRALPTGFIVA